MKAARRPMAYDASNIFRKIIDGEIPCRKVFENSHALAFHDVNPVMPVHVLVIPKGRYATMDEFARDASAEDATGALSHRIPRRRAGNRHLRQGRAS